LLACLLACLLALNSFVAFFPFLPFRPGLKYLSWMARFCPFLDQKLHLPRATFYHSSIHVLRIWFNESLSLLTFALMRLFFLENHISQKEVIPFSSVVRIQKKSKAQSQPGILVNSLDGAVLSLLLFLLWLSSLVLLTPILIPCFLVLSFPFPFSKVFLYLDVILWGTFLSNEQLLWKLPKRTGSDSFQWTFWINLFIATFLPFLQKKTPEELIALEPSEDQIKLEGNGALLQDSSAENFYRTKKLTSLPLSLEGCLD